MSQNVTYDDRDPILDYSPGWFRTGTYNATSVGQTGTLASSKITNVNVTFVFPTPATEFFYFGIKRCCGGSYLICIDCDPNHRQFVPINAVDTSDNGQNPPVVLYSQKFSVAGIHEVILMNNLDPAFGGNSEITLDRFELTVPDPAAVPSASASPTSSLNLFSTPTASSALAESPSSSSSSRYLAPVLGGVLGGLAILLIIVGIWLLVRRRSRRPVYNEEKASTGYQSQSLWQNNSTFTSVPATISTAPSRRELDAGRIDPESYLSPEDTLPPEYGQVFNPAGRLPESSLSSGSSFPEQPRAVPKSGR
ncbi:hypothetical protein C8R44DRAFT_802600 [Mycena epipterygia]|nr:hypothetical protein C8R44DRAFT_802600 [Mycena epipterygia]